MPSGGVRIQGLNRVLRGLQQIGLEVDDLKDAFAKIASQAADVIEAATPRLTGRAAGSVRGNRAKSKAVVAAGGATVPYIGAINYGWPARGIPGAGFMQAADESGFTAKAVDQLEEEINAAIRRRGLA